MAPLPHQKGTLNRTAPAAAKPCPIRAIPYAAWDNRTPGPMTVWLYEQSAAP